MNTGTDTRAAATDLADALETFADHAVAPGTATEDDVCVAIGTPYGIEQRTVRLPINVADWITELLRDETRTLEAGPDEDGGGQDAGVEPAWW
ncbi:hypothetical protein [Kitasatospora sp. NPDC096204]|uniref:hypothetical protein n=1 Tax=Kitasatospora sp. NPDC096204 TaxID=3364094 RepID=UPI00382AD357